jgi:hypothetical protein
VVEGRLDHENRERAHAFRGFRELSRVSCSKIFCARATPRKANRMSSIKFPVVKGKQVVFPKNHLCPWCRKRKLGEPPGAAILNAGAMRPTKPECYEMAQDDAAFMTLIWHSNDPKNYDDASIEIAELVDSGQFDLNFCSTDCLRAFLNYCVDELEQRRKRHKQPKRKSRKSK